MRTVSLLAGVVVAAVALAGCGSGAASRTAALDRLAEAKAALPADLRRAGVLVGGTDPTFEPMTFMRDGQYAGLDIDLGDAIVARLGLKVRWTTVTFGSLLDQVRGHQIDFSMTSMFDKAKREAKADFVDYLNAGTSIVVRKGTGDVGGMAGLCGKRLAAQPATVFIDMAQAQQTDCGARGLTVVQTNSPSADVAANKADAALNDFPIAASDVEKIPGLELSGPQIEALPYGIGVAKDRRALTMAIQTAFYKIVDDGTYDALLAKWKVKEGALKTGALNGGV